MQADQVMELPQLQCNDLIIEDLGFFNIDRFKTIIKSNAWFLSRHRFNVTIYTLNGNDYEQFDLLKQERKMDPGDIRSINVFIGAKEKLPVRLILEKVDSRIAAGKRRKLKYDKQNKRKNISSGRLRFCNLNAYITNTTEEQISKHSIRKVYSLRWQIEILFKAWKSVYKIDAVKPMKLERFECMHYGVLLLIILTHHIMAIYKNTMKDRGESEMSELKFFSCIKETLPIFEKALNCKQKLRSYFDSLWLMIKTTCLKDQKQLRNTPFTILGFVA